MKIVTGNFDSDYKQMSIYDFLQDGESQEVAPSETLPQVDEAQDDWDRGYSQPVPSSALDVVSDLNIKAEPKEVFEISTEDTDKTLFSVGDVLTVKKPMDVYDFDTHPEDYNHLLIYGGKEVTIENVRKASRGTIYGTDLRSHDSYSVVYFYERELQK